MMIVSASIVEISIGLTKRSEGNSSGFSALRALRLFRIFKMAKNWKSLHALLETMYETALEVGNFTLLLVLMMYVYALLGMQLFANRMHFDPDTGVSIDITEYEYEFAHVPRSNFDSLSNSMTTVFQILSGENWNSVYYDCRRATSAYATFYFISLVIFGVFIVMNLFLAILIGNFEGNDKIVQPATDKWKVTYGTLKFRLNRRRVSHFYEGEHENSKKKSNLSPRKLQLRLVTLDDFQRYCRVIAEHPRFDNFITACILFNTVCLALDSPLLDPKSLMSVFLNINSIFFTTIFLGEMLIKMTAHGIWRDEHAYLKNNWNVLDATVVLISLLDLVNVGPGNGLRALRTLRVLRPLRMIGRFPELKLVVNALVRSLPSVANVAIICTHFFLVFAIFGVNFLKGTFYSCNGEDFEKLSNEEIEYLTNPKPWGTLEAHNKMWIKSHLESCSAESWTNETIPTSKEICNCIGIGLWKKVLPQNFDNVFSAMSTLFEISTTEGWVDVMLAAVDQRGIDNQPVRDSNWQWAVFFILFLVIGAFFVLELFVGVIIEQFKILKARNGSALMTKAQQEWASTQAFIMKMKPEKRIRRPETYLRGICYDFIMPGTNPKFERFIMACIALNTLSMTSVSFGDSHQKTDVLEVINIAFSLIFVVEALLKIFTLRASYFDDNWNRFDFIIIVGTCIGQFLAHYVSDIAGIASFMNLFRICRLLRLVKSVKNLRMLFNTLFTSLPSMINVGGLLFLLFFIYAICGVQLFSLLPFSDQINDQANFRSFGNAMM